MRRLLLSIASIVTALVLTHDASAASAPLVLRHPVYKPGNVVGLEVVAPRGARSCRFTIKAHHRVVARRGVSLGGPTRMISWRVGRSARGSFAAALSCSGGNWSVTRRTRLVVKRSGRARGTIATRGSMRVQHGRIPEMPAERSQLRLDNPLYGGGVVINPCMSGVVGCFNPCPNSEQIKTTRTTGDGAGIAVQLEPTGQAKLNSASALASIEKLTLGRFDPMSESYVLYKEMWVDLKRCANLPGNLSGPQRHSLYEQMACHALYGANGDKTGNTWDLEAWHKDVDWADALDVDGVCGEGYGDISLAPSHLNNTLVKVFDTHKSTLEPEAWLVKNRRRRRVASPRAYDCLVARGRSGAKWFPRTFFIAKYFSGKGDDVSEGEACGPAGAGSGGGGSGGDGPDGGSGGAGDYTRDGVLDVLAISKQDIGSGRTAIHVLDGASGFSKYANNFVSVLHHTGADFDFVAGDYTRDGVLDVLAISKQDIGSGRTAIHVLDGASGFSEYANNFVSVLHHTGADFDFVAGDYTRDGVLDVLAISKQDIGSGRTAIHVLDGASGFSEYANNFVSVLHHTGADFDFVAGDYTRDGVLDVLAISKQDIGSGRTAIHVLDGASGFSKYANNFVSVLHHTGADFDFVAGDYTRDGVLDVLAISKQDIGSGRTAIHVLDGASGFSKYANNFVSVLHHTGADFDFVAG